MNIKGEVVIAPQFTGINHFKKRDSEDGNRFSL
jgi:hypothetical protein